MRTAARVVKFNCTLNARRSTAGNKEFPKGSTRDIHAQFAEERRSRLSTSDTRRKRRKLRRLWRKCMSRHTFQSLFWMLRDFFKLSTVITRRIRPCLLTQKMPTSNFSGSSLFSLRDWFHFKPTCPSGACEDLLKIPHGQKHTILAIFDFFCLRERFSSNVSRIL